MNETEKRPTDASAPPKKHDFGTEIEMFIADHETAIFVCLGLCLLPCPALIPPLLVFIVCLAAILIIINAFSS